MRWLARTAGMIAAGFAMAAMAVAAPVNGVRPGYYPFPQSEGGLVVLGFAGDLGFSGHNMPPSTLGAVKYGALVPWARMTEKIAPLLRGADANFANLETVVTPRADLTPIDKAYNFAGSPEGLRQAVAAGVSVVTAANNHAGDYGTAGIEETLAQLAAAKAQGLKAAAGLGIGSDRYKPDVFTLGETRVGVAAVGIGINHAGPSGAGQPLYASPADVQRVARELAAAEADVRVLSVHYGRELEVLPAETDRRRLRNAADASGASILFAHHSHVPSGVERRGEGVIFYGLGNFLHPGTQDLSRYDQCRDFGLYAKVYLWVAPGLQPVIRAVELVPLRGTHITPEPFPPAEAARRIALVNGMSAALAEDGREPLRFSDTGASSGLACFGPQIAYGDALAARCRGLSPLTPASVAASACKPLAPVTPPAATAQARPLVPKAKPAPKPLATAEVARPAPAKQKTFFLLKLID